MDFCGHDTQRLVHVDLKGAPPKIAYFEKFFPLLKDWGITGVLLEWEDTFPYVRELASMGSLSESSSSLGAPYASENARELLEIAAGCGLTIIPLVQTLGHLEFALKHSEWSHLREVENFPSSMCPSHSEALPLVRSMLKQVIAFHKPENLQFIHIGADEVWHMGICPSCSRRAAEHKHGKASLFLEHVSAVARFLKETYPHIKIIMWDDMLRNIDVEVLQYYEMGQLVEPMVWHYFSKEHFQIGPMLWDKFSNVFTRIWAASAFKGATGSCQVLPIIKHHTGNHEAWLNEIEQHGSKIGKFMGICITGWSRYDHYATLCELLPASLPSLANCLKIWRGRDVSPRMIVENDSTGSGFVGCFLPQNESEFPGFQVFRGVSIFIALRDRYRNIAYGDQVQTWLNPWQIQNRYTNPMQIQSLIPMINELLHEFHALEIWMKCHMDPIFYAHTIDEWIGTNISPVKNHLQQIKCDTEFQLSMGCCIRGAKKL